MSYDPLGRLWQVSAPSGTTRFLYDGEHDVIEFDGSGSALRAYVFGDGADEPLVWWENGPNMLHADRLGSIVSVADNSGNVFAINRYDEFGNPQGGGVTSRFGYTGQMWLPEIGQQYSKARMYSPALGRFLQTDPIGPADDANLYAYTGNDPVNNVDPLGLAVVLPPCSPTSICITAPRLQSSAPNQANSLETRNIRGKVAAVARTDDAAPEKKGEKRPAYCRSMLFEVSTKAKNFGGNLSNFAGGVVAAGALGKNVPIIEAGETVGAVGMIFQSLGVLGRYAASGNTSVARLEGIGIAASYLKSQTRGAQLLTGLSFDVAVSAPIDALHLDPCE